MFFLTDIDLAALLTMEDSVPKFLDSPYNGCSAFLQAFRWVFRLQCRERALIGRKANHRLSRWSWFAVIRTVPGGYICVVYSQFCYYIQKDEEKRRATMHIPRKPGEQIEVDWLWHSTHNQSYEKRKVMRRDGANSRFSIYFFVFYFS